MYYFGSATRRQGWGLHLLWYALAAVGALVLIVAVFSPGKDAASKTPGQTQRLQQQTKTVQGAQAAMTITGAYKGTSM